MGSPVMQWQIVTSDLEKVAAFYTKMFRWSVTTDNALGYRMVKTGAKDGIDGRIWPAPPNVNGFVQLFMSVDGDAVRRDAKREGVGKGGRFVDST